MCGERVEVSPLEAECIALAQKHNISHGDGHDKTAQVIRWDLSEKCDFERTANWFYKKPDPVCDSEKYKLLSDYDFKIQTDHHIEHNKPDINKEDTNPVHYI